jgi:hypothetical protein
MKKVFTAVGLAVMMAPAGQLNLTAEPTQFFTRSGLNEKL